MSSVFSIRDMSEHQFYIMNCTLILNRYYSQNIDFGKPLFFDIEDENGIVKIDGLIYKNAGANSMRNLIQSIIKNKPKLPQKR